MRNMRRFTAIHNCRSVGLRAWSGDSSRVDLQWMPPGGSAPQGVPPGESDDLGAKRAKIEPIACRRLQTGTDLPPAEEGVGIFVIKSKCKTRPYGSPLGPGSIAERIPVSVMGPCGGTTATARLAERSVPRPILRAHAATYGAGLPPDRNEVEGGSRLRDRPLGSGGLARRVPFGSALPFDETP